MFLEYQWASASENQISRSYGAHAVQREGHEAPDLFFQGGWFMMFMVFMAAGWWKNVESIYVLSKKWRQKKWSSKFLMSFNAEPNGENGDPKLEQFPASPNARTLRYISII